ncbi:MAG: DUF790 family protein [Candidatus Poribacteria bacterium]
MLTSELLRHQIQHGQISVIYVNPESEKYLRIAQDIIDIYAAYLGKTRGELNAALEEYEVEIHISTICRFWKIDTSLRLAQALRVYFLRELWVFIRDCCIIHFWLFNRSLRRSRVPSKSRDT